MRDLITNKLFSTYLSKDGLLGISFLLVLGLSLMSEIGGDTSVINGINGVLNAGLSEDSPGFIQLIIGSITGFLSMLGYLSSLMTDGVYTIHMFGNESITGLSLLSERGARKANAIITYLPIVWITLLLVLNFIPRYLLIKMFDKSENSEKLTMKEKAEKLIRQAQYIINIPGNLFFYSVYGIPMIVSKMTLNRA